MKLNSVKSKSTPHLREANRFAFPGYCSKALNTIKSAFSIRNSPIVAIDFKDLTILSQTFLQSSIIIDLESGNFHV